MSIGIIGAGALGSNLARAFARGGIRATISNNHGPQSLGGLVKDLGTAITPGTTQDSARADIVFLAIRWADLKGVLGGLRDWNGRVVVDCTNPVEWIDRSSSDANDPHKPLATFGLKAVDLGGFHSSAVVRGLVPGARLVKAFNHLGANALGQPPGDGGRFAAFYSGDDVDAKSMVRLVIEASGFFPIDLGALDVGGPLTSPPAGPLAGLSLKKTRTA
jgi:8-hydroxy-5-deazaflavin:NADPH oxidoreductase